MRIFTWKQRLIVLSVTLAVIGFFVVIAYFIGRQIDRVSLALAVGVLFSYPFSQWMLYLAMKKTKYGGADFGKKD